MKYNKWWISNSKNSARLCPALPNLNCVSCHQTPDHHTHVCLLSQHGHSSAHKVSSMKTLPMLDYKNTSGLQRSQNSTPMNTLGVNRNADCTPGLFADTSAWPNKKILQPCAKMLQKTFKGKVEVSAAKRDQVWPSMYFWP